MCRRRIRTFVDSATQSTPLRELFISPFMQLIESFQILRNLGGNIPVPVTL